jgi:WD40-like Beta Propeller Repeat
MLVRLCGAVLTCALLALASAQAQTGTPTVSDVGAREIADTSVVLGGRVVPNGSHTTYRFEYGNDTSYGNATPLDNAGSGTTSMPVWKPVTGLQPNTTYHFRLVATNASGDTAGPDATFTTTAQPPQPSGRAYEMVSPVDKNGGDIARALGNNNFTHQTGASALGDAVAYVSRATFGDVEAGALFFPTYAARRSAAGWATEGITPPMQDGRPGTQLPAVQGLAPDLSRAFVLSDVHLTPEAAALDGSRGLYMRRVGQTVDRYRLLSIRQGNLDPGTDPPDTSVTAAPQRFEYEASTPDGRHVVFNSGRRLLQGAPPDVGIGEANAVYEWVDGNVRLASVLPTSLELTGNPLVIAGGGPQRRRPGQIHGDHMLSDDGRRIYFQAEVEEGAQLFVREDGTHTRVVSQPPGRPSPINTTRFWAAKRSDGSVAFFTSNEPLTAGAGRLSLYRWDANAPQQELALTELSKDIPDQAGDPLAPGISGPAAVSEDASSVYFVATGVLVEGAPRKQQNLYLWKEGEVRHLGTLDSANDARMWQLVWVDTGGRAARVTPDGERLLFASYAPPANFGVTYDATEESQEACGSPTALDRCRQIYLYDAGDDRFTCLTCVPGAALSGDANLFGNSRPRGPEPQEDTPLSLPRNLSSDGRRAFFETDRPLVAADKNATIDVYEWEDRDLDGQGELRLVSSGRGTDHSLFLDASLSGDDVFFTTREQLVGIDTDNQVDLYDARVGGGIPAQNPPPPASPCEGELCQGAFSVAPLFPALGSGSASHGDLRPRPRPSFSVTRLSRGQRARLARGQRVAVRVRVNRAGKVSLTARAKLGRRMRAVDTAVKIARKAGRVMLGLKLSSRARRVLARQGRLNVSLVVRFAGVREARTSTLRLRRAQSGERGAA